MFTEDNYELLADTAFVQSRNATIWMGRAKVSKRMGLLTRGKIVFWRLSSAFWNHCNSPPEFNRIRHLSGISKSFSSAIQHTKMQPASIVISKYAGWRISTWD